MTNYWLDSALTVQQLIDKLKMIPDKTKKVIFESPQKTYVEYVCAVYDDTWIANDTVEWSGEVPDDKDKEEIEERIAKSTSVVALSDVS